MLTIFASINCAIMELGKLDCRNATVYLSSSGHINLECICQFELIYYDARLGNYRKCNGLFGFFKSR